jgi:hypothetical protein
LRSTIRTITPGWIHETMTGISTSAPVSISSTLARNLGALRQSAPELAAALEQTSPAPDIEFFDTSQGVPGARYQGKALCSRKHPRDEAARLVEQVDVQQAGVIAVTGFALGYHVEALLGKTLGLSEILVFEPDLPLLRAVLERIDHAQWLGSAKLHIVTQADDSASLASALHGHEPFVALGVKILEHPPSASRLSAASMSFSSMLASLVGSIRTVVITTMVQTEVTVRNALMNMDSYLLAQDSTHAGVADLANLCQGRPAVLVAAGPSLSRTIAALRTPGLRNRCVIIAAQTVLQQLLREGVRPHFVTALDYHAISTRFYEGLSAQDVEGITLIAEPKVNPAVPMAWPGIIRCPADSTLDLLLESPQNLHGTISAGATVAHLNYYLARHMGCDPVILTGQDLGFTDGLYYGNGASIHKSWACELNPFTTLEMLEWERIVRGRGNLHKTTDHQCRPMYTDDQMTTYLSQFEREFLEDAGKGRTTIDATQGGVAKSHCDTMSLEDAINLHAPPDAPPLPDFSGAPSCGHLKPSTKKIAQKRLQTLRQNVVRLTTISRQSKTLLEKAIEIADDEAQINTLIEKVYTLRDEVHTLQPAFDLVQRLNQTGAFNRAKADRNLRLATASNPTMSTAEIRKHQLERDIVNVTWLADAGDTLAQMLLDSYNSLDGGEKPTALPTARLDLPEIIGNASAGTVAAVILDEGHGADVQKTVDHVRQCQGIDQILVIGDGDTPAVQGATVCRADLSDTRQRLARIEAARRFSTSCWRSGVNALTCFDSIAAPLETVDALESVEASAALLLGSSWSELDTELNTSLVARHRRHPEQHRVVFSQASPGTAGIVLDIEILRELAAAAEQRSPFATIGGLLRYNPRHPTPDPIAKQLCVSIDHTMRDAPWNQDSKSIRDNAGSAPNHLVLELTTSRSTTGGIRSQWLGARLDAQQSASTYDILELLDSLTASTSNACVTFAGVGDPLLHADLPAMLDHARELGLVTHVRTDLLADDRVFQQLLDHPPDVFSVDVMGVDAAMHEAMTGSKHWDVLTQRLETIWNNRQCVQGVPRMWLVPRITRCDEAYEQIEQFYDFWTAHTGSAVIDPMPRTMPGSRFAPLSLPDIAQRARDATTLCLRTDGSACHHWGDHCLGDVYEPTSDQSLTALWQQALAARFPEKP